jgi:hypothetical protein
MMRFWKGFWPVMQLLFTAVGILTVFILLVLAVVGPEPETSMQECRRLSIVRESLLACHRDTNCSLSNEEMFTMYRSGKGAVIACTRANQEAMYEAFEEALEKQEAEKDKDVQPLDEEQARNDRS